MKIANPQTLSKIKNLSSLKRSAIFTDIHFGKKANSTQHNTDCLNFIDWFISNVKKDKKIDNIIFLGDWHENRSTLNISTLTYSYIGIQKLVQLDLPIFFIVGNHDLYFRHTRDIHSVIHFDTFDNVIIIDEPTLVEQFPGGGMLAPYLFHEEYPKLIKYNELNFWGGHFEFKDFEVTSYGIKLVDGPSAEHFDGPAAILSGHFHKRQRIDNVIYIGNTFPMDFGDAGDNNRGMAIYDHTTNKIKFINWKQCPKYIKTTLSQLVDNKVRLEEEARVRCIVDIPVTFEETQELKNVFIKKYNLREFALEESRELQEVLTGTDVDNIDWNTDEVFSVDDMIEQMLQEIQTEHIDNNLLIKLFRELK